jgi:hypothetical protein
VLFGLWLAFVGVFLAVNPLAAARVSNRLRFVAYPEHPRASTMRYYRFAGLIMTVLGIAIVLAYR